MAAETVARRYVRALFEVAREQGQEDVTLELLQGLQDLWTTMPELRHAVNNPQLPPEKRISVLRSIVGDEAPAPVREFLRLIVQRSRVEVLRHGGTLMARMLDEARGLWHATVTSALPLSDDQQEQLREALRAVVCCDVALTTRVDPGVIGGVAVQVGDLVLDGSIRQRLQSIRRHFERERQLRSRAS